MTPLYPNVTYNPEVAFIDNQEFRSYLQALYWERASQLNSLQANLSNINDYAFHIAKLQGAMSTISEILDTLNNAKEQQ